MSRLSLRARLILGVVVLAALGLATAGVVTYISLQSFLVNRTDEALAESQRVLGRELHCPRDDGRSPPGTSPGDYIEIRVGGRVVCSQTVAGIGGEQGSPPVLPTDLETPTSSSPGTRQVGFFNADAEDGNGRFRVSASTEPVSGATLVVATPLDDVDATLQRLLLVELLVAALVLGGLTALGLWVVRLGLRPLDDIERTAGAIAGGDLSQRVERSEPTTEVGRLGMALNAMLAQIESAFRAREASERRLRRFVADASHELRTPLAGVRAYAELFTRGADQRPDDLARAMRGIGRESERMTALVDDLLLLARLDEGRPLDREPVDLAAVARDAVETARAVEPDRPIELDAAPAYVVGDADRLRQVVDNLLANARAHTPGGTRVTVRVATAHDEATLEVADRGPGMTAEEVERVFERFWRADDSRTRASGGAGLGLSIVAAVAEAHGGTASVDSAPGAGAAFTVRLPATAQPVEDAPTRPVETIGESR